jgi:sugar fermentation stimulation protein A
MKLKLQPASFIKRYKRFLVDVEFQGETLTVHCPNTGSMTNCYETNDEVYISKSENLLRKYPYTLEIIKHNNALIGVNTSIANKLVSEAILAKVDSYFDDIKNIDSEVTFKDYSSRVDFVLTNTKGEKIITEVKNVTLVNNEVAMFPDAVTLRGQKHLSMLIDLSSKGHKTCLIFCVQHESAKTFEPAKHIDSKYALLLAKAKEAGVKIIALKASFAKDCITLNKNIPIIL